MKSKYELVDFIYAYIEAKHELVEFIYAYFKEMKSETDLNKMVLKKSFTLCMDIDVSNDALKIKIHHFKGFIACNNLILFGIKQIGKGGL